MSQSHVRVFSGQRDERGIDTLLGDLPGLLSSAANQYLALLRRSSRLVEGLLPSGLLEGANDCCGVPTQDCPPHCIAEICWEGCACEPQRATVTVKNTGNQARNFAFVAGTLGPAKVEVSPPQAQLAPGQSVTLEVLVPGNQGLKEGETYSGEMLIRGAYEQCVKLRLRVAPSSVPQISVEQGEVPQRISELKWYRHWQCIEPCESTRRTDDTNGDRPPTVNVSGNTSIAAATDAAPPKTPAAGKTAPRAAARKRRG